MDEIIYIVGSNTNNHYNSMILNIVAILIPIIFAIVYISIKSNKNEVEQVKCGCGRSASGLCDGSHESTAEDKENGGGI